VCFLTQPPFFVIVGLLVLLVRFSFFFVVVATTIFHCYCFFRCKVPNAANAAKKEAKKAAKKAAKEAHKTGGGSGDAPAPAGTATAAPPRPMTTTTTAATGAGAGASTTAAAASAAAVGGSSVTSTIVPPHHICINPNTVNLEDRPVVALTVAILTNTILDYTLMANHRAPQPASLGLPNGMGVLVGDFAMARYIGRVAPGVAAAATKNVLFGFQDPSIVAKMEAWIDYASSMRSVPIVQRIKAIAMTLEHALGTTTQTYVVGHAMDLADLCLFAVLGFPTQVPDLARVSSMIPSGLYAMGRWMTMMAAHPALRQATQLAIGVDKNTEAVFETTLEPLVSGMSLLEGAVPGMVVTRFPPEPSGYLHIGHAKAVLLNDYYARRYKGRLIVRFDDTNPSKEKEEYQQAIVEDLAKLGVVPTVVTFTSDYFEKIAACALQLIANGLAYMDDTPQEIMKEERGNRIASKYRATQTPAQAKELFEQMCSGKPEGATWCLRAKIDMASDNGTLRDPVLFRPNYDTPHHRTGTKFKAYPTYDLACPIVDSMEGVTHALRTTEYNDRDEQYQWILTALQLRRVRIHAFARVNFMYTVLSKRKLTWFVEQGIVTGWDDPRFPTVRGVVRRGIHVPALKRFMYSQGASRRVVNMEWSKFWAENKKDIDGFAKRYMAIDEKDHVLLSITNAPSNEDSSGTAAFVSTTFHPKDPTLGQRALRIGSQVLLETVDVQGIVEGEDIVLLRWGVIKMTKVTLTETNVVTALEGEFIPNGDFQAAKRKLSWMAQSSSNPTVILTEFDNLVSKEKLEETDKFEDFINPHTMATTKVIGDAGLKTLQQHEIIQLERRGYYRVDRPYTNNTDKPLVLFMIPDGKTKAMSGLSGKLAHR
jgi:glutamyl-tRNA synthetase